MFGADLSQLLALGPTKISVLLLYRRIFGARGRRFNLVSMTLIVLVIMWTVAFFFTNTFQYYPVHTQWAQNPMDMRPSMELTRMFLSQSYADVALDIMIVSLPIPLSRYFLRKSSLGTQKVDGLQFGSYKWIFRER
jgi:hypothetical protein